MGVERPTGGVRLPRWHAREPRHHHRAGQPRRVPRRELAPAHRGSVRVDGASSRGVLLAPALLRARPHRRVGEGLSTDRYGAFDDHAREYVVTRPDTPLPWINYLGTENLFGIISNTGGGYAFYRDARLRRLTRYRYNSAPADVDGRHLYVRDDDTGDYWSPSWQPVRADVEDYRCRHGLGYTVIGSARGGIDVETLYFVPLGVDAEVWRMRVTNTRSRAARVSVFGAVEFCLWDAYDDATNFQRNYSTGEVAVEDRAIFHVTEYRERRDHFAYFACSEATAGFDTDRDSLLGPYRGWDRPVAVERGEMSQSRAHGWAPCAAHQVRLALEPGETREIRFLLGYWENPRAAKFDAVDHSRPDTRAATDAIQLWLDPATLDSAVDALAEHWEGRLDALHVATPNPHVDRTVNIWNPYQCMVTYNLSRSASLFESGVGRGMGFRDSNQDTLGFVHTAPGLARRRILDLAATQLRTGGAYHQYQPLTKRGNDAIGSGFNDDPLWLIVATASYLKETGDGSILDDPVPYESAAGSESPLYEHLQRALRYTIDRRGRHGLPLIGRADWNDCLNLNCFSDTPGESFQTTQHRPGRVAESVFIAGLFVLAAGELAAMAERRGHEDDAASYRDALTAMSRAVRDHAWDGAWFLRAYDDYGRPVGSATDDEGRIYVEPQGMCVMAGIGVGDGRASAALAAVREHLASPDGIALLWPAYTRYRLELGEISSYPPGYKENGGVFCHTNPWITIATARLGDGDGALDSWLRINPSAREDARRPHRSEPYVYAQMIAGPEAATPGEAKNSWLTGTAAWSFVAVTQWILGIRPDYDGLRIDPCLPAAWDGFCAQRRFRGATYDITVRKEPGVSGRVQRVVVDGRALDGNLVPPALPGAHVTVEATVDV
jgi:cellobiose phosphorylase